VCVCVDSVENERLHDVVFHLALTIKVVHSNQIKRETNKKHMLSRVRLMSPSLRDTLIKVDCNKRATI